jgi:hypothetical protein
MTQINWRSKLGRILAILVAVAVLLALLLVGAPALAQDAGPVDPDDGPVGPASAEAVAEYAEVGTEWIAYFTQCPANNIPCEQPQCERFYYELRNNGWAPGFNYGNCNAWARDFKRSAIGGTENSIVDASDIVLFCDHGSSGWDSFWNKWLSTLHFGCDGPDNDCNVSPGEAYNAWGDNDLEWIGFKACSVLGGGPAPYYNRGYWAATMDGLHLILGFRNSSYCDNNFGKKWAQYMLGYKFLWWWVRPPYTVKQAWFEAVDDTQPGGVCARVLAEDYCHFSDKIWGRGGPACGDSPDSTYHWWDHCSCTPPPQQLGPVTLAQIQTLPIYEVVDRTVDDNYVLSIGSAFDMEGTEVYSDTEYYYILQSDGVQTFTVQVDKTSGGYKYRDVSELFVSPVETPTLLAPDDAMVLADEFFADEGKDLPGAAYHTGDIRTIAVEERVESLMPAPGVSVASEEEVEVSRTPVLISLSYGRVVTPEVTINTPLGMQSVQATISLVGPGARTKMYLGDGGDILGVQGGSRDIINTGEPVSIMDASVAWDKFLSDPSIALATIPYAYDEITRIGETLGYYEFPQFQDQSELIPTWVFSTSMSVGGETLPEGTYVYVPASAEYMPPVVEIETPAADTVFESGEMVSFSGSVLEQGKAPFTYEWSSSHDGFLGNGESLEAPLTAAVAHGSVVSHTITLQVIDANGQQGTDSTMVYVKTGVYLPLVTKGQ